MSFKKILLGVLVTVMVSLMVARAVSRRQKYTLETSGKLVVLNKLSRSLSLIDLTNGKKLTEIKLENIPQEAVAIPNTSRVAITTLPTKATADRSMWFFNTKTLQLEQSIDFSMSPLPKGLALIPGTNNIAVATRVGNDLIVVDLQKGTFEKRIPTEQKQSFFVVLHPIKPLAYITHKESGSVSIINTETQEILQHIATGRGTEGIDITPDGTEVWVTNAEDNTLSIIETTGNSVVDTLITGKESLRLKFTLSGTHCLVTNSQDGTVLVYDRFTRQKIKTILIPGKKNRVERLLYHTPRPMGIALHSNGRYAFVTNSNADKVEVIDLATFEIVSNINTGRVPDGLAFVED